MKIGAVILAAGFSRRLGRPKQQLVLQRETLLVRAARTALVAGLAPVIAVIREVAWADELHAMGVTTLFNGEAQEGMASSVRAGVRRATAERWDGAVLMACDQPALRPEHLRALCAHPEQVTASFYAGRKGVPAYFPAASFAALLSLQGDSGARRFLEDAAFVLDEALALDVDTEEDLRAATAFLQKRSQTSTSPDEAGKG